MRGTFGRESSRVLIIQISRTLDVVNGTHFVHGLSLIRFVGRSVSAGDLSGFDFVLRASYDIVDPCSDILNLIFSVKPLSNLVVGLDESL